MSKVESFYIKQELEGKFQGLQPGSYLVLNSSLFSRNLEVSLSFGTIEEFVYLILVLPICRSDHHWYWL